MYVRHVKTGALVVVCLALLMQRLKRPQKYLRNLLDLGFKRAKFAKLSEDRGVPGLKMLFDTIPAFVKSRPEYEAFSGCFKVFFNGRQPFHPFIQLFVEGVKCKKCSFYSIIFSFLFWCLSDKCPSPSLVPQTVLPTPEKVMRLPSEGYLRAAGALEAPLVSDDGVEEDSDVDDDTPPPPTSSSSASSVPLQQMQPMTSSSTATEPVTQWVPFFYWPPAESFPFPHELPPATLKNGAAQ